MLGHFSMCKSQTCTAGEGDRLAVRSNRLASKRRCKLPHSIKAVTDPILSNQSKNLRRKRMLRKKQVVLNLMVIIFMQLLGKLEFKLMEIYLEFILAALMDLC